MFNESNHGSARALYFLVHFLTVLCKQQREMTKFWLLQASTVENSLNLHDNGCYAT